jgi:hypothetical protein
VTTVSRTGREPDVQQSRGWAGRRVRAEGAFVQTYARRLASKRPEALRLRNDRFQSRPATGVAPITATGTC